MFKSFRKLCISVYTIRGAQTAVFELDIRISNPPYIDVCESLASEAGLKSRNVENKRCLSHLNGSIQCEEYSGLPIDGPVGHARGCIALTASVRADHRQVWISDRRLEVPVVHVCPAWRSPGNLTAHSVNKPPASLHRYQYSGYGAAPFPILTLSTSLRSPPPRALVISVWVFGCLRVFGMPILPKLCQFASELSI
jgi:hypothetical protein